VEGCRRSAGSIPNICTAALTRGALHRQLSRTELSTASYIQPVLAVSLLVDGCLDRAPSASICRGPSGNHIGVHLTQTAVTKNSSGTVTSTDVVLSFFF
jgi:hypothetical protein